MKKFTHINLTINIVKQANRYIAYSPALDLSTSGRSETEARKRFSEAALLFIEELDRAGTLKNVLGELGWRRTQKQWEPPRVVSQEAVGVRIPTAA